MTKICVLCVRVVLFCNPVTLICQIKPAHLTILVVNAKCIWTNLIDGMLNTVIPKLHKPQMVSVLRENKSQHRHWFMTPHWLDCKLGKILLFKMLFRRRRSGSTGRLLIMTATISQTLTRFNTRVTINNGYPKMMLMYWTKFGKNGIMYLPKNGDSP